jgi:hypothetical protein
MTTLGKILRTIVILLVGMTAALALLSGIGTTCVALGAQKYASMAGLVDFKGLYLFYVVATIAAAVYAIYATVELLRGKLNSYRDALLSLSAILVLGMAQVVTSRLLRGSSMPNDLRVYLSGFTLLVLLLLHTPKIWNQLGIGPADGGGGGLAAGASLFLAGVLVLTAQVWAAPSHTFNGVNYAGEWHTQLLVLGLGLLLASALFLARWIARPALQVQVQAAAE